MLGNKAGAMLLSNKNWEENGMHEFHRGMKWEREREMYMRWSNYLLCSIPIVYQDKEKHL
jgi:hypothetical protein